MTSLVVEQTLKFRLATPEDAASIVALVTSGYRGEASRVGWTSEADLVDGPRINEAEICSLIADPESAILIAEIDGNLVGCCNIARREGAGYFGMFAVHPNLQSGGIGRLTLAEAERRLAHEFKCHICYMQVLELQANLIAWYERRGYERTGDYKDFPYGDANAGSPLRSDLRFVILMKSL